MTVIGIHVILSWLKMAADGSNDDSGVICGVFQQAESKFDDTHAI